MEENFYEILGVSRDADLEGIRRAYRSRVRRLHPDVNRVEGSAQAFLRVQTAYETLSDADKRREYDRRLRGAVPVRPFSAPTGRGRPGAPFASPGVPFPVGWDDPFIPLEELFARLFTGRGPGWLPPREPRMGVEVILTPAEAARGGRLPLHIPLEVDCPRCLGTGIGWIRGECLDCLGRGRVRSQARIDLNLPAGIRDGAALDLSLARAGLPGVLRVAVRVRG
jgi:DnaJ-class molecular chaperone